MPDTEAAIKSCVELLKPGAPLLLYLYYSFDNRPWWFRCWRISDLARQIVYRLPSRLKHITDLIAVIIYVPLTRFSRLFEWMGWDVSSFHCLTTAEKYSLHDANGCS